MISMCRERTSPFGCEMPQRAPFHLSAPMLAIWVNALISTMKPHNSYGGGIICYLIYDHLPLHSPNNCAASI